MSLEITLKSGIGEISVTIHGEESVDAITFDDNFHEAIAYDRSMIEFGESETELIIFLEHWEGGPFATILNFSSTLKGTSLLCTDFVEHIGHLIPKYAPEETVTITDAIVAVRKYFMLWPDIFEPGRRKHSAQELEEYRDKIRGIKYYFENTIQFSGLGSFEKRSPRINILHAIEDMLRVGLSEYSTHATIVGLVQDLRDMASKAMAWDAGAGSPQIGFEVWTRAMDEERAWQFRRLVDVTDAITHGKPYPPLEATK